MIALLITYRRDLRRRVRYPQLSGGPCGVRRVPRPRWPTRRLRELMVPLGEQVMVAPDARMDAALGTLQDGEAGPVLVAQAGQVVGIITPSDLTHRPPRQQRSTSAPPEPVEWAARPQ